MLSDSTIALLANTAVSVLSILATSVITYLRFFQERKLKRIELYTANRHAAFREFIAAYSDLHMLSSFETQREFLKAWRTALSVSDGELFNALSELSFMDSTATIKPSPEADAVFFRCVRLISEDFRRNISRRL